MAFLCLRSGCFGGLEGAGAWGSPSASGAGRILRLQGESSFHKGCLCFRSQGGQDIVEITRLASEAVQTPIKTVRKGEWGPLGLPSRPGALPSSR